MSWESESGLDIACALTRTSRETGTRDKKSVSFIHVRTRVSLVCTQWPMFACTCLNVCINENQGGLIHRPLPFELETILFCVSGQGEFSGNLMFHF